jgi:hypothetical protein
MIETLRRLLEKAYGIPERTLVWVNIVLAGFVALAHGGALALTFSQPTPDASEIRQLASISLPIVIVVLISAAAALITSQLWPRVLAFHGIVLSAGVGFLLLWALGVLFNGAPEGVRFSWSVGFLSASACYASVLLCRFSFAPHLRSSWAVYYGPVITLACAALVDVGVFVRVVA